MSKPIFQDIVPPDKRSIKKIPIPNRSRRDSAEEKSEKPKVMPVKKRRSKVPIVLTLIALVALGTITYLLLPKVTGAVVTLIPKGQSVSVDAHFSATPTTSGTLSYQVVVYQKDGKLTIPANGTEHADVKATGVIRIFNNYSSEPQKLVANTRFESTQGKIYRISKSTVVPGKSGDTPGSIDVTVMADATGADYNVGLTDFTIPGFKDDPRYAKIFARSKSEINGGFSGIRKKVDESQVKSARQEIQKELQSALLKQMQQNVPDKFIFLQDAYFIDFASLNNAEQGDSITVTERAVFRGIIFKRADLAQSIAEKAKESNKYDDLLGTDNLKFIYNTGSSTIAWESNPLVFSLKGTSTLISAVDINKLKEELAGRPRKNLTAILAGYPSIAKAQVVIRPFWKQYFPERASDITVNLTLPNSP